MKREKVVIYARQSSGSDDQSESIDFQIQQCQEMASSSHLEVIGIYADYNTSGRLYPTGAEGVAAMDRALQKWQRERTFEKQFRPELGKALALLPTADYLMVYDSTRLCRPVRNSFLQQYLDNILIESKVKLMTVKEGCSNPMSFTDSLVNSIKSQVNDNQTQLTAEKSKKAMIRLRDSGIIPTCPKMFGIRYLGGKNKEVEVIPECLPVIRFAFEQILLMKPYNQILRDMNRLFKGASAGKAYYDSSLRHIIAQPFYCGMMYDSSGVLIQARQMLGKEIVSYETWRKANDIMARNRKEPQRRKMNPHPFTHLLRCGYCGAKMIGGVDSGKEFYHCHRGSNLMRNNDCPKSRVTLNLVRHSDKFTGFKEAIAPVLALAMFNELQENEISEPKRRELVHLESRHRRMQEQKNEIRDRYAEGRVDFETFEYLNAKLKKEEGEVAARITKLKGAYSAAEMARRAKEYLARIEDVMADRLEPHLFETLLRQAVKSIYCFEDRVEIETVYGKITLRRYVDGRCRNFPRFVYRILPKEASKKVIDLRQAKIEVTYIYAQSEERKVVVDFSVMKILEQI
jgi:DNA invertase Pin-like site-specific DNA recombinase